MAEPSSGVAMIRMQGNPGFEIKTPKLQGRRVFLGTPNHINLLSLEWVISLIRAQRELGAAGVTLDVSILPGDPMVDRARNRIVADFLKDKENTHLLFVDDDIEWHASDLIRMLGHGLPFLAGACPSKKRDAKGLERFVGVVDPSGEGVDGKPLVKATRVGTGFLLLAREVFEAIESNSPAYDVGTEKEEIQHAYFHSDILPDETGRMRWFSEDYVLCEKWKRAGGEIWLDTLCELGHAGRHVWRTHTLHAEISSGA